MSKLYLKTFVVLTILNLELDINENHGKNGSYVSLNFTSFILSHNDIKTTFPNSVWIIFNSKMKTT